MASIQTRSDTAVYSAPEHVDDALFEAANELPQKEAVVDGSSSITYASLAEWVDQFAADLRNRGISRGDRVSLFFDKTFESVVALYGVWRTGAVAVPVNGGLRSRQIEHIVRHSGSKFFVAPERKLKTVEPSIFAGVSVLDVRPLSADGDKGVGEYHDEEDDGLAAILYTSGSTGQPKGIALSHANICAGARIVSQYLELGRNERILSVLPFSFDYGLNQLTTAVRCGATSVLQRSPLPADIYRALVRHEITGLAGVPSLWIQMVQPNSPFLNGGDSIKLRYITNSGGMLPVNVVSLLRKVLPHTKVYLMYGLTEAFRSTYLPPEEIDRRPNSIGKAIPECEIYVLSEDGSRCAPGQVGELVHRGPTVAQGYWQDAEATAAKFRPNPFAPESAERVVYSGDLVKMDEDGYLYFVARRDEMIKSVGYRISPTEVEDIIHRSGMVSEVVVKGVPDDVCGAVIAAHCVPARQDGFSCDELLAYCKAEMPSYMVPRSIVLYSSFPRTASGKIDRKSVGA